LFEKGQYTRNIFSNYKKKLEEGEHDNIVVASIPFVRNLIEYTEDDANPEYILLTSVLHYKDDTKNITLKQIKDIINNIYSKRNQSAWLIKAYRDNINDEVMSILDIVAMITPENIHLNSFMFEPILDMSSKKLYEVYQEIKTL
jgi:hypothetical protein